jgi:TonB-linked SusC/RagA family outer membrane protein
MLLMTSLIFGLLSPEICFAQNITLSEQNIPLERLFPKIETQSGYNFAYTREMMQGTLPVTISVKNRPLEEVLNLCFTNQPLTYKIIGNTIVVSRRSAAVKSEVEKGLIPLVSGRIIDSIDGTPLVGATISVAGTLRSVIAGEGGGFELTDIPPDAMLEFSFVGYESYMTAVMIGQPMLVRLQRLEMMLKAVEISTGLYMRPLETFTGASSIISGTDLRTINPTNFLLALTAIEPALRLVENNALGSDPNNLPIIQLRGQNNLPTGLTNQGGDGLNKVVYEGDIMSTYLSNPNQPLLVLDGFQTTLQYLNDMDITQVERVTVLKDAAATAAYGSKAANGVIVIETKRPAGKQLRLNYTLGFNVSIADLSSYKMMHADDFLEAQRLSGVYSSANNFTDIGLQQWYDYRQRSVLAGVNTDWLAQPVRNGYGSQHSLTLSGGNDNKIRFALGIAYMNHAGVMKASNRRNINLNNWLSYHGRNIRISNRLTLSSNQSKNTTWGNFSDYVRQFPYFRKLDSAGNIPKIFEPSASELGFLLGAPGGIQSNVMYNSTLNVKDNAAYLGLMNNLQMDFTLAKSLHLRAALGVTLQLPGSEQFYPADHTSFVSTGGATMVNLGSYETVKGQNKAFNAQVSLDYSKQIMQHAIYVSLGFSAQQSSSSSVSRKVTGSPASPVDDLGMLNGYNNLLKPVSSFAETRNLSNFISATYTYGKRYTLEGTFNQSGSSQFGTNNRLAPFWAVGTSWLADKEKFFMRQGIFTSLRFFANLGLTGNQNFGPYAYSVYQYNMTDDYRLQLGTLVNSYATPNLKWQQTQKYSFGTQFSFLENKVNVNASFFIDNTDNLILPLSVAPSTGFVFYNDNLGATESKGYEITIGTTLISNTAQKIFWSLALNAGHVNTTIKTLSPAVEAINKIFDEPGANGRNQTRALPRYKVGQSMTTIWAVQSLGIDPANGFEMFRKLDGSKTYEWNPDDKVPVADANATLKGAITTNFSWKAFSLNLLLGYQLGGYMYNQTLVDRVENVIIANSNASKRVLNDRWQQPGDIARFKALSDISITNATSRFVQKNDFIEATSISLAYNFPSHLAWVRKLHLNTPRLSLTQANVFRLGTIEMERGTDYPFARTFSFGLTTNF